MGISFPPSGFIDTVVKDKEDSLEQKKVIRSAGLVSLFTLASRFLGLVREILMGAFFGTTLASSAFYVAFAIPNLFRRLFGEGALSAAFVPVFMSTRSQEGEAEGWILARRIVSLVTVVLVTLTVLGILVAQLGLAFAVPGGSAATILSLVRIMLPYMVFICLAALSMGILNSLHHFAVPAATPMLLNLIWITALLLIVPRVGVTLNEKIVAVAWAVVTAGVIQLACQIPMLIRHGFRPGWDLDLSDPRVRRILILMGPAALGMAVAQFNVVIDKVLAIWVGDWAPSALVYAERLVYLPLGLFATALGTVLLPTLSGHITDNEESRIPAAINHALRNLMFVMIPAAVGLLVLARPIIQMIYERGEFGPQSTTYTSLALQFYAPGLVTFSLAKVFVPAFYARQDTRTPVRIAAYSVGVNLVLNIVFVLTWPAHMKHAGLAFASVISSAFNGIVLAVLIQRRYGSLGWRAIGVSAGRSFVAAMVMACAAGFAYTFFMQVVPGAEPVQQIVAVLLAIGIAAPIYFLLAWIFRSPELKEILAAFSRKR